MMYLFINLLLIYISLNCISSKSPFKTAIWLILDFILISLLLLYNTFNFIALIYILIYGGALTILFLFAIIACE